MDLHLSSSKSGPPTCAADGLWLHSRYDPEHEALRFAESTLGGASPSHVVLLGPCLDYLSAAVRARLPGARIVVVQYSSFFAENSRGLADQAWHPGLGSSLEAFLDLALDEDAISGVAVLEWEPASRAFPEESLAARTALRESLERLSSSTATVKASGRRWIANACSSFLLIERAWATEPSSIPILVAAAGPSLRSSLAGLGQSRGRFATLAVSSALAACRCAGIEPDIVVSTDGGFWSRLHLYPLAAKALPLAAPLTALPSAAVCRASGFLLLDQGTFAESQLLPSLCPALRIPPHGTVSGTAIQLAARLSEGPILVAGLDLASFGDIDHARPHGFDALADMAVSRIAPLESAIWARGRELTPLPLPERPWRSSRSLSSYAGALSLDSSRLEGRLFRLGSSPVHLRGFAEIGFAQARQLLAAPSPKGLRLRELELPALGARESLLRSRLRAWRDLAAESAEALGEGRLPGSGLVSELLRSIDIVDYAAARRAVLCGGEPGKSSRDLALRCEEYLTYLERRFAP